MTKIGIDARTFSVPNPGGAVRNGIELTNGMHELHSDLHVFGHPTVKKRLEEIPVDAYGYRSATKWFGMLWEQTLLPKRASDADVDVLYSPVAYCPAVPTDFQCVITVHDLASFQGLSAGWYNAFERVTIPRMVSRADAIVTVSEFSKSKICSELDVKESKVHVVYNGVNDLFLADEKPDTDLSLPNSYILYVGALSTRKNISGLLKAFSILKQKYGLEHDLVLIGPEDDPTNESDVDAELIAPLRDSIHQLGYVSDLELKHAYTSADVFAFPSLYEGFGIPPLEAMACGTPVVASNRTAIPEVLGDAPVYVDPTHNEEIAEGLHRVLTDAALQKELIENGYEQSQQYQWDNSAGVLLQKLSNISQ